MPPPSAAGGLLRGWRLAAALGPALVVLLLGTLIVMSERGYTRTFARVEASILTESALERAFSAVHDVELEQRSYLMSQDSVHLVRYARARQRLRREVDDLLRSASGLEQHRRLREIAALVERRVARLDSGLALYRRAGPEAAYGFAMKRGGFAIADSIRVRIDTFQVERERELAGWRETERRYHRLLDIAVYLGTPLAMLLAVIGSMTLARAERVQRSLTMRAWRENEDRQLAEHAVQAATVRARVLANAGAALASSLDADQALETAARAAVPDLADLCTVDLMELDGRPRRAGVAHVDPEVAQLVRESAVRGQRDNGLPSDVVLRTGEPVFIQRDARAALEGLSLQPAQRAALQVLDPESMISVPMLARGTVIGALTLTRSRARRAPFTEDDVDTARELARRTTSAVETARVFRIAVAARAEAEQANRAKSTFLATMSHELRTPLNAVLGYVDLLDAEVAGPLTSAQRDYIGRVRTSGRHLLGLIAEILDLAKVEAGQMRVRTERARVAPAVGSSIELVRPLADSRRITVDSTCPSDIEFVGDEDRVRQILVNLLSNAVKFTESGGTVTVECRQAAPSADLTARLPGEGPWIAIAVHDTGIGIPHEKLEAIFAPFVQVDSGHTREVGGTGLGLSISRSFARLMEGDLTVDSQLGTGSTFTLWLPAPRSHPEVAPQLTRSGEQRTPANERRIEAGHALASRATEIVRRLVERLRTDEVIPQAHGISHADLEDHIAGYVTDLAQSITIVDAPGDADRASLARDGDALQYAYAVRHGAQRRRLGWPEAALRREYALLAEEVERALRRSFGRDLDDMADDLLPLVRRLNEAATERALDGWRG